MKRRAFESRSIYKCRIIHAYPHDNSAFTQGLEYFDGLLYESTGLQGFSSLRKVNIENGKVIDWRTLPQQYFGEGLTIWKETIIQLTWRSCVGLVYNRSTLDPLGSFRYSGEGWGLTNDGHSLIMSDGTAILRFFDPSRFSQTNSLIVASGSSPLMNLNELQFVRDQIYANILGSSWVACISPVTGQLLHWIDLSEVSQFHPGLPPNGIAYSIESDQLFVTGKFWPKLYEIELTM